jgi:hypothetical protein
MDIRIMDGHPESGRTFGETDRWGEDQLHCADVVDAFRDNIFF